MSVEHFCAHSFIVTHPDDAARQLEQFPADETAAFLAEEPAPAAAALVSRMGPVAAAASLRALGTDRAAAIVTALAPDVAASLVRRFPSEEQTAVLAAVPVPLGHTLRQLLTQAEGSVGSVTDPNVLALSVDMSVGEAQHQLRDRDVAVHHHVYVIDRARRLVGVVHLRELMRARSEARLAAIMQPASIQLPAAARLTSVSLHPAWQELDALPVVDDGGVLLGIVRHRQLRRLQPTSGTDALLATLLSLGELYWLGLSTVMSIGPVSPDVATEPGSKTGATHAR